MTLTGELAPREALFVQLLGPLVITYLITTHYSDSVFLTCTFLACCIVLCCTSVRGKLLALFVTELMDGMLAHVIG